MVELRESCDIDPNYYLYKQDKDFEEDLLPSKGIAAIFSSVDPILNLSKKVFEP